MGRFKFNVSTFALKNWGISVRSLWRHVRHSNWFREGRLTMWRRAFPFGNKGAHIWLSRVSQVLPGTHRWN